jgi:hypothetical protein
LKVPHEPSPDWSDGSSVTKNRLPCPKSRMMIPNDWLVFRE